MATILVVDDEPGLRAVLSSTIKSLGHTVLTAENGNQAIETVKSANPDAIFLDIRLPDMDGLQILEEVKKINPGIPVIMCSGFADVESAINTVKMGAFDYISKPFKREEVLKAATKALEARRAPSQGPAAVLPKEQAAPAQPQKKAAGRKMNLTPVIGIAAAAAVVVLLIAVIAGKSMMGSKPVIYSTAYANPTAVLWDGKTIWACDWVTQSIYRHNMDDKLTIAGVTPLTGSHPTGLAYDGQYLWSCDSWAKTISKRNIGSNLSVVVSYPSPGPEPSGLYWDGMNLWVCDSTEQKIYKVKVEASGLAVDSKFASPCRAPVGIFTDGKYFWVADSETNGIYRLNIADLSLDGIYAIPELASGAKVAGMTYDGKNAWVCFDGIQKIGRYKLSSFKKTR